MLRIVRDIYSEKKQAKDMSEELLINKDMTRVIKKGNFVLNSNVCRKTEFMLIVKA